jgi:hypothetical protein
LAGEHSLDWEALVSIYRNAAAVQREPLDPSDNELLSLTHIEGEELIQ